MPKALTQQRHTLFHGDHVATHMQLSFSTITAMGWTRGCMSSVLILITAILLFEGCNGQLVEHEYDVEVTTICPETEDGTAHVTIMTELQDTYPYAECFDDYVYDFDQVDTTTWMLEIVFSSDDPSNECVFNTQGSQHYVNAYVPMTTGLIFGTEAPHVVNCTYGAVGDSQGNTALSDSKKPIEELMSNLGVVSNSDVRISVVDINGDLINENLSVGRYVKIHAWLLGNYPDDVSFQAVSCDAVSSPDLSYNFLTGGCGDGTVLEYGTGFITTGKFAVSPYFKVFRLHGSNTVTFNCTFVTCNSSCDGSSCELAVKRKRELVTKELVHINHGINTSHIQSEPLIYDIVDSWPRYHDQKTRTDDVARPEMPASVPKIVDTIVMGDVETLVVMVTLVPFLLLLLTVLVFIVVISHTLFSLKVKVVRRYGVNNVMTGVVHM